jgi:hypothetical protein
MPSYALATSNTYNRDVWKEQWEKKRINVNFPFSDLAAPKVKNIPMFRIELQPSSSRKPQLHAAYMSRKRNEKKRIRFIMK